MMVILQSKKYVFLCVCVCVRRRLLRIDWEGTWYTPEEDMDDVIIKILQ